MTNYLDSGNFTEASNNYLGLINQLRNISPLLDGEDENHISSFIQDCIDTIKPNNTIEAIYIKDFIYYSREATRLQCDKVAFINLCRQEALKHLLRSHSVDDLLTASDTAEGWAKGDKASVKHVKNFLKKYNLDEHAINAKVFQMNTKTLDTLEKLIASCEFRRDKSLREIQNFRKLLGMTIEGEKAVQL